MAQYRESMSRLLGWGSSGSSSSVQRPEKVAPTKTSPSDPVTFDQIYAGEDVEESINKGKPSNEGDLEVDVDNFHGNGEISMLFHLYKVDIESFLCLSWICLFITYLTKELLLENLHIPVLGIVAATIANCVPIGGGVVYVPAFALLGVEMKLGVAFSVATMSIGNGGVWVS